jgi:hypothetical protein
VKPFFAHALWLTVSFGALAAVCAGALGGAVALQGAAAGGALAVLDLGLLAVAATAISRRTGLRAAAAGLLLSAKFPILGVVLYLLVVTLGMDPLGLLLGFGSLPAAMVAGVLTGRLPMELRMSKERSLG